MEEEPKGSNVAPYISFGSFVSLLDWLKNDGVPDQLDRSVWERKYSGSVGKQLMTALRYLKLLDGETTTPALEKLATAEEADRKEMLRTLLRGSYPELFDGFNLARATPKMLDEAFSEIGGSANTRRKAIAFFVNGCKFADVPLSNQIKKMARNRSAGSGGRPRREPNKSQESDGTSDKVNTSQQPHTDQNGSERLRIVTFDSGGSLTLALDVDLFELSKGDRDFVIDLVDRVNSHASTGEKEEDTNDNYT